MRKFCQSNRFGQIKLSRESYDSLEHSAQSSSHLASKQSGKPMSISCSTHILLRLLIWDLFLQVPFLWYIFIIFQRKKNTYFKQNITILQCAALHSRLYFIVFYFLSGSKNNFIYHFCSTPCIEKSFAANNWISSVGLLDTVCTF